MQPLPIQILAGLLFFAAASLPAQPRLEAVAPLHRAVHITWSIADSRDPAWFRIYRSIAPDTGFRFEQQVPGSDRSEYNYWLDNGRIYYFRLTAVDANGNESGFSNTAAGMPSAQPPAVYSVTPNQASNDSLVCIQNLSGINFYRDDLVKLVKSDLEIPAQNLEFGPDQITCCFDLHGREPGIYDLVIERDHVISARLRNAFTITSLGIRFTEVSAATGLTPNNYLSFASAWGDFDNDGWLDLFVANHEASNQLFRNDQGHFTLFGNEEMVGGGGASGIAWLDYDNDGDLDLFVSNLADDRCLLENQLTQEGAPRYVAVGTQKGLPDLGPPGPSITGAAWADYDQDGRLDLYLTDNREGSPNRLYRNLGDTLSRLEPVNIGLDSPDDESYSPLWADYDNDGDMDLYVCNGEKNRLYENQGEGSFQDITEAAGVGGLFHTENAAWGDFDNDGFLDLYLANTNTQPNILYQNLGAGRFTEFTLSPIINDAGEGFAAAWGDYDNDGDLDLFLARAGYREHFLEGRGQVNRLFENQEGTFVDIAAAAGVADSLIATAAIWGDYDNDGFLDIFVAVRDERSKNNPAFSSANKLYRNSGGNGNNHLKLLLHGTLSNANGVGARIELHAGGRTQIRAISGGEGRSHAGVMAHFGLGQATSSDFIKVKWPSGIEQTLRNEPASNTVLGINEPRLPRPSSLRTESGRDHIRLAWNDNRENTDIVTFTLYRDTVSTFNSATARAFAGIDSNGFVDTKEIASNVDYIYWIRGNDQAGNLGQLSVPASGKLIPLCEDSGLLGNFTAPCDRIDHADLSAFADAYRRAGNGTVTSALRPFDIGPAAGTPPELVPLPDGKINFEDVVVFVQMWRWYIQSRSFVLFENQNIPPRNPEQLSVELMEIGSENGGERHIFELRLKQAIALKAAQFQIKYDAEGMELEKIAPGRAFYANGGQPFFMEHGQKDKGFAVAMICPRDHSHLQPASPSSLLRLEFRNRSAARPSIMLSFEILDAQSGLRRRELVVEGPVILPRDVTLLPNYPNPFNPSTRIRYGLPSTQRVRLSVLNVLGQEVVTLVDEEQPAGFHSVVWDGFGGEMQKAGSGVYFCRLEAGSTTKVMKMIYLR